MVGKHIDCQSLKGIICGTCQTFRLRPKQTIRFSVTALALIVLCATSHASTQAGPYVVGNKGVYNCSPSVIQNGNVGGAVKAQTQTIRRKLATRSNPQTPVQVLFALYRCYTGVDHFVSLQSTVKVRSRS